MLNSLRSFILEDSAVQALIGSRFYPDALPQAATFPAVTYAVASETSDPTMRHNDNLPLTRVQIDAWARSPDAARATADAIRSVFQYFEPGDIGDSPGHYVAGVFPQSAFTQFEPETKLYRYSRDYIVHHAI